MFEGTLIFVFSILFTNAHAEHSTAALLAAKSVGNTGRAVLDSSVNPTDIMLLNRSGGNFGSGALFGGCILSAGHVPGKADSVEMYSGPIPDIKSPGLKTERKDWTFIGDPNDPSQDIVVMKLSKPLPISETSLPETILAETPNAVLTNPKTADDFRYGRLTGYGNFTSSERKDDKTNKFFQQNEGGGIKRAASLRLLGYGAPDDPMARAGAGLTNVLPESDPKSVLWATHGPHIGAQGDSGGLIFDNEDRAIGVLSMAFNMGRNFKFPFHQDNPPGLVPTSEITANAFAPIPKNRAKILAAFKKLGCYENTKLARLVAMETAVKDGYKKSPNSKTFSWAHFKGESRDQFENSVRDFMDWGPKVQVDVKPLPNKKDEKGNELPGLLTFMAEGTDPITKKMIGKETFDLVFR